MVKKILIGLVVLLLVLVGVAYLLPREVHVERSVTIATAPSVVYGLVTDFNQFDKWSPWAKRDPNMKSTITGTPGVGHTMEWSSEQSDVGSGKQTITEVKENELVVTALDFGEMGTAKATFRLEAQEGGAKTKITWGLDADMGNNPIGRYMGLMMDTWVGADYEKGLTTLKTVAEGTP